MAANTATLSLRLKIEDDNTIKVLDQVGGAAKKAGEEGRRSFARMDSSAAALERTIVKLGAAYVSWRAAKSVVASFIDAAKESEGYRIRLNALLGSAEKGQAVFAAMNQYAAQTPFEFQAIMGAATQLAGIMKGGVDQIKQWMPMIGDLAAVSGLSIEETTDQVVKMYSAGAGAADLFRVRGILAMMGFQAGVTYSAEETRKRMMEAWTKADSQFRGVTKALASSWTGLISMLQDKWFILRNKIMDAGVFDALKKSLGDIVDLTGQWIEKNENLIKQKVPEYLDDVKKTMIELKGIMSWFVDHWEIVAAVWFGYKLGPVGLAVSGAIAGTYLVSEALAKSKNKTLQKLLSDQSFTTKVLPNQPAPLFSDEQMQQWAEEKKLSDEHAASLKHNAELAQEAFKSYQKAVTDLEQKIKLLGMRERDAAVQQAVWNVALKEGEKLTPAQKQNIADLAGAYYDLSQAKKDNAAFDASIQKYADERGKAWETYYDSLDKTSAEYYQHQVQRYEDEYDRFVILTGDKEAAYELLQNRVQQLNEETSEETEDIWEHTAEKIQDALANGIAEGLKGNIDSFRDLAETVADVFADAFAAYLSQGIMKELKSKSFQDAMGSAFGDIFAGYSRTQIGMGLMGTLAAGINAAQSGNSYQMGGAGLGALAGAFFGGPLGMAIGASVGGGLGGLFGSGPSFGSQMSAAIDRLIATLDENTRTLKQQAQGLSDFDTTLDDMTNSIMDSEIFKNRTLAGNFSLPDIAKLLNPQGVDLLGPEKYWTLSPGDQTAAAMEKFYTGLTQKNGKLDLLGVLQFRQIMQETTKDGAALVNAMKKSLGLSDITGLPWDIITEKLSSGSQQKQMANTASAIVAIMDQAFTKIDAMGKQAAGSLDSLSHSFDVSQMSPLDQALAGVDDKFASLRDQADQLIPFLQGMLDAGAVPADLVDSVTSSIEALKKVEPEYKREYAAVQAQYAKQQAETIKGILGSMDKDLSAYTHPLSGLEQQLEQIKTQGKSYYDSLVDGGMETGLARMKTDLWVESIGRLIKAQDAAIKAEDIRIAKANTWLSARSATGGAWSPELALRTIPGMTEADVTKWAAYMNPASQTSLSTSLTAFAGALDAGTISTDAYTSMSNMAIGQYTSNMEAQTKTATSLTSAIHRTSSAADDLGDAFKNLVEDIQSYRNELLSSGTSPLGLPAQYSYASSQLQEAVQGMYSKNAETAQAAIAKIPDLSRTFLGLSEKMGGIGQYSADYARVLALLNTAEGIAGAKASFAGGGTISGPAGGYTIPTTFHGTEHITPDSQMSEVKEVLSDVRGVLIQIRDVGGAQNLATSRLYKIIDRVTQKQDYVRMKAVS